jgi:glycosyltransferase involved in cell wall biosynthesis
MLISVIVTTYNWPEALAAVLRGLRNQKDREFEVIVADDGSDERTREGIRREQQYQLLDHVWHEHRDFRAAAIRNRAIKKSTGEYVIFLDGDCIPRPSFVRAHRRLAEDGCFVMGNRLMLREQMTWRVLAGTLEPQDWSVPRWFWMKIMRKMRIGPMFTLPLGPLRKRVAQTWRDSASCNFGAWRRDLYSIDGFDSHYVGWGCEDNDLFVRLLRAGVKKKTGRWATGVIHLHHEPAWTAPNRALFEETMASDRILARTGLSAL